MVLGSSKVGKFKPHRNTRNVEGWTRVRAFPWRDTEQEAQSDLEQYAKKAGLMAIDSAGESVTPQIADDDCISAKSAPAAPRRGRKQRSRKAGGEK